MTKSLLVLFFGIVFCLSGCDFNDVDQRKDTYLAASKTQTVFYFSAQETKKWLDDYPDSVVVDVRTPDEFRSGHLKGAINLDVNDPEFENRVKVLVPEKKYLLYCRSGARTEAAKKVFQRYQISHIAIQKGGILAWMEAGFALE